MPSGTTGPKGTSGAGPVIVGVVAAARRAGRTSTLANLAWLASTSGLRVLLLDLSGETRSVASTLAPFEIENPDIPPSDRERLASLIVSAGSARPRAQAQAGVQAWIRAFQLPLGGNGSLLLLEATPTAGGSIFVDSELLGQEGASVQLRARLRQLPYDVVLVDAPTESGDEDALRRMALLLDAAIVCIGSARTEVTRAARLADALQRSAQGGIRLVATVGGPDELPQGERDRLRRDFLTAVSGRVQPGDRVPGLEPVDMLNHQDLADGGLVAAGGGQGPSEEALAAYLVLADRVMPNLPIRVAPVPPVVSQRYRSSVRGDALSDRPVAEALLIWAPGDRAWADWIATQLSNSGVDVARAGRPGNADLTPELLESCTLVVVQPSHDVAPLLAEDDQRGWQELSRRLAASRVAADVLLVTVGPYADWPGVPSTKHVDLGVAATDAARRDTLLRHFGLDRFSAYDESTPSPGSSMPTIDGLPRRHRGFAGREGLLERIRDAAQDEPRAVVLTGPAGAGKSGLAGEYAHRFRDGFDVTWWVDASTNQSIADALRRLGRALDPDGFGSLEVILSGSGAARSRPGYHDALVVFDGVEDDVTVDDLMSLLPAGLRYQVLITGRRPRSGDEDREIEVGALSVADVHAIARRRLAMPTAQMAQEVHAAVAGNALALRLGLGWIQEAAQRWVDSDGSPRAAEIASAEFIGRLEARAALDEDRAGGPASSIERVLGVVRDTLSASGQGRMVLLLSEFGAFLSPNGVSKSLLVSRAMLRALVHAADRDDGLLLSADSRELDSILWLGHRYRIWSVTLGTSPQVLWHPSIRQSFLDGLGDRRADRQLQVLQGLARYAPTDAEEDIPGRDDSFTELQRHVITSGAVDSDDYEVRRWLVNQARHLYLNEGGNIPLLRAVVVLIREVDARWSARHGEAEALRLRLNDQLANLLRLLGNDAEASVLEQASLRLYRRSAPRLHAAREFFTRRGLAADARAEGDFEEAYHLDSRAYDGIRRLYGASHEETLRTAHNLATSLHFQGDTRGALRFEREVHQGRRQLFGDADVRTLRAHGYVAVYLRELGELDEARDIFRRVLDQYRKAAAESPDLLRLERAEAVAQRRTGDEMLMYRAREANSRLLELHERVLGPDHRATLACRLSHASDFLHSDDAAAALPLGQRSLQSYEQGMGTRHPFTNLARTNVAMFSLVVGEVEDAVERASMARKNLQDRLGRTHPWTLGAWHNLNRARRKAADPPSPDELRDLRELSQRYLGASHPTSRTIGQEILSDPRAGADRSTSQAASREVEIDVPDI